MIVDIEKLTPNYNPLDRGLHRVEFFNKIVSDVEKNGLINPLICLEKNGNFEIIVGNNRYFAAKKLGITKIDIEVIPENNSKYIKQIIKKYKNTNVEP